MALWLQPKRPFTFNCLIALAGDAVLIAPVSMLIPPLTGNFTGKFAISGALGLVSNPKYCRPAAIFDRNPCVA